MSKSILPGIQKTLESALKIKDDLGIAIAQVHMLTRRWTGANIGDGDARDESVQMLPSPSIVDLSQDVRLTEAGAMKRGDLILKGIVKTKYTRDQLLMQPEATNVEGFYVINGTRYKPVHVKESLLTWSVHIRPQVGD